MQKISALLNFIDKHSLKVVHHRVTHLTRTTTTISDAHIVLILIDLCDQILNLNIVPSTYEENEDDTIRATIKLFLVETSNTSFSYRNYKCILFEALIVALVSLSSPKNINPQENMPPSKILISTKI